METITTNFKNLLKVFKTGNLLIMLLGIFILFACGGDDPKPEPPKPQVQKSKEAKIKTFQFVGQNASATIDNNNKTIRYTVAHGTNITALTATATFSAKATINPDPKTARNYTKPQTFTVTAEDGKTKSTYTVTVNIAPSTEAQIKTFQFAGQNESGKIDNNNKTIHYTVAYGTNITALTATVTFSAKASISPDPKMARNYTKPQTFTVTAEDGKTKGIYRVSVKIAPSTNAQIKTFTVNGNEATINQGSKLISYEFPYNANNPTDLLTNLTVRYTHSDGATVQLVAINGRKEKDYSVERTFTVTAQNTKIPPTTYQVQITIAKNSEAVIKTFRFENEQQDAEIAEINENTGEIRYTFPNGTDLTKLKGTATLSVGARISPNPTVIFGNGQTFTVTAQDGKTTKQYTVKVKTALSDKAQITKFQFNGQNKPATINETNKTITYNFPANTDISNLTATVEKSNGATISPDPGTTKITSGQTFTVRAQNGKEIIYTVTFKVLSNEAKITAFALASKNGVVNETKKEIIITHPYKYDATNKKNANISLVTNVTATLTKSQGATITPDPTKAHSYAYNTDNTKNYKQKFTVTSEDGNNTEEYTVKILFTVPQTADKSTDTGKKANLNTLMDAVYTEIQNAGFPTTVTNRANLNHLDMTNVTNMAKLFDNGGGTILKDEYSRLATLFNGNISEWNVSNVTNMNSTFTNLHSFNGDISKWDVTNVIDMGWMFAASRRFKQDLSEWNTINVKNCSASFLQSGLAGPENKNKRLKKVPVLNKKIRYNN